MASIHQEIVIEASPEHVWDAVRDVGAIHERLAPGFVTDTKLEDGARVVTFGNGMVARELIVDLDDAKRRLAWSVQASRSEPKESEGHRGGGRMTHHNASLQVFAEGEGRTRAVWIADLLPHELGPAISGMIAQGLEAIKKTLER
ncbi:MAG: SRPBCC family protein [Deltaproteobacteria bacterium]|nr:MAG: SRPBCC family protein [Deltaproteobacteria bacterium]